MKLKFTRLLAQLLLIVGILASFSATASAAITVTNTSGQTPQIAQGVPINPPLTWLVITGSPTPVQPYTFTNVTGLPTGVFINSDGTLSGSTCDKNGSYKPSFTITDANGNTGTASVQLNVTTSPTPGACSLSISPSSLPNGTTNTLYPTQTITATGGTGAITYTVVGGALPTGLTLNPTTGQISGTPTVGGTYTFTVQATDSTAAPKGPKTATQTYTITIDGGTPVLTANPATGETVGGAFSQTQTTTGGTPGYTYSATGLPDWATINPSTGEVTGAPDAVGPYSYTVTVTDSLGKTASQLVSGTIGKGNQAPLILSATLTSIPLNGSTQLSTTGGSGTGTPVTYAQVGGTGTCSVDANGLVTATVGGTCIFEATKPGDTNYNPQTSNQVTINVSTGSQQVTPAISLSPSTSTIAPGQTVTMTVGNIPTDAKGPVTYAVSGPCSVSPNPSTVTNPNTTVQTTLTSTGGAGTCSVTATMVGDDKYLPSVSDPATITVAAPDALTLGPAAGALPAATIGTPYQQQFTAQGGTGPTYTYSIEGLPGGMTFNTATGLLSGTPNAPGTYNMIVCVTDSGTPTPQKVCQNYTITVGGGIGITTNSLPAPTLGSPYAQPIAVAGAIGPVVYAITAGALPAGLALDPKTGVISGNTQASGCYNFTVTATDKGTTPNMTSSKAYSFCVTRPDPSQDQNVRGIISSQARAAYRFVRGQIALIQSHLDSLHDDDDSGDGCSDPDRPGAVQDFCVEFDNKVQVRGAQRTLSGQEQDVQNLRKLNDVAALADPTGVSAQNREQQRLTQNQIEKQSKVASVDPMINTTNNTQDGRLGAADPNMRNFSALAVERSSNYPARTAGQTPEVVGPAPKVKGGVKVNVWTAGEVDFGRYDNQGRLLNEKFNVGSLAVGADMRVMPGLRAGVAFGYGNDYAQINYGLANSQAQNFSATGYASYRIAPGIFVDGLFGYGDLHYFSNRLGGDGTNISGNRTGYALFQSLALTVEKRYGGFKFAPYVRVDGGQVYFNGYSEVGSREWALSYNGANTNTVDAVAGIRASYDYKLNSGGVLTPNARAQFQKFFTSSVSQWMNYAIDPSMSYNYFDMGQLQWMFMGTLGTQYTFGNVSAGVDYVVTTSGARYLTNGLRGNIRVNF